MTNPWNETVYSIWIGTNDLGNNALLTDTQRTGTNIVNYTDCVYSQLKRIYDQGGRYFILQNVAPLNLAPLYATAAAGGVSGPNQYWPGKPDNITEISYRMMEQVVTVNRIYDFQTPFVTRISEDFREARFAVMDMHGLVSCVSTTMIVRSVVIDDDSDLRHLLQPLVIPQWYCSTQCAEL